MRYLVVTETDAYVVSSADEPEVENLPEGARVFHVADDMVEEMQDDEWDELRTQHKW